MKDWDKKLVMSGMMAGVKGAKDREIIGSKRWAGVGEGLVCRFK